MMTLTSHQKPAIQTILVSVEESSYDDDDNDDDPYLMGLLQQPQFTSEDSRCPAAAHQAWMFSDR